MVRGCKISFLFAFFSWQASAQLWDNRFTEHTIIDARKIIDSKNVETALQEFVDKNIEVAFRYLGDSNDFNHGHLLYADDESLVENGMLKPFAILYHTQENASSVHRDAPGTKYDYLDRTTRNWVQFFDYSHGFSAGEIINAREFATNKKCCGINESFTVHASNIDYQQLPQKYRKPILAQRQIEFNEYPCDGSPRFPNFNFYDIGTMTINIPSQTTLVCLDLHIRMAAMYSRVFYEQ